MTADGGRRQVIRLSRPTRHREPATEPLPPLGGPTCLESGFSVLSVGLGEAGGGRKRTAQKPCWCLLPRSSAARSSDLVNTLKNKGAVKATREPL